MGTFLLALRPVIFTGDEEPANRRGRKRLQIRDGLRGSVFMVIAM
jgi:hypothetical protein